MKKLFSLLLCLVLLCAAALAEESIDLTQLFDVENSIETLLKHYDSVYCENLVDGVPVWVDYVDGQIGYSQDLEDSYAYITAENGIYCWAPNAASSAGLSSDYYLDLFIDDSYMQEDWYWYDNSLWIADGETVLEFEDRGDTLYLKTEYNYTLDDEQYSGTATYTIDAQTHAILESVELETDESGVTTEYKCICKYNAGIPEKAQELLERANPAAENAKTNTFIIDPGTDEERTLRSTITKDDVFNLNLPEKYGVFWDAEGTQPVAESGDYGSENTLYLLPIAE